MAQAKKCDRCDRYFDKNTIMRKAENYNGFEEPVNHLMVCLEDNGYAAKYDLCDECWEKFFNWMNDYKLDEEIEEEVESKPYVEKDTECDKCEYLNLMLCENCMESTHTMDSRRHYIRSRGGRCLKEEAEMADM